LLPGKEKKGDIKILLLVSIVYIRTWLFFSVFFFFGFFCVSLLWFSSLSSSFYQPLDLYMVLHDEKMGIDFCTIAYCPLRTSLMSGNGLHVLNSCFGNGTELVALASGYKQFGIVLAFYSNGIEFLTTTTTTTNENAL
jgi:hypothetical protein